MSQVSLVWLITGSSSGLGRSLAQAVLQKGHRLVATARNLQSLEPLASAFPETCKTVALDVTNPSQVQKAVDAAIRTFGRLDVLVNNAGVGLLGALEECSEEEVRRNFETNFFGPLAVIRTALPVLREQRAGHIINISAAAAISNYAGFSIYGASKCALEGASESLAAELKPLGIKVTLVQPGPFRTDFLSRSIQNASNSLPDYEKTSGKFAAYLKSIDGKQPGNPDKAAAAIVEMAETDSPPLRLVLGKYAVEKVRKRNAFAERELASCENLDTGF